MRSHARQGVSQYHPRVEDCTHIPETTTCTPDLGKKEDTTTQAMGCTYLQTDETDQTWEEQLEFSSGDEEDTESVQHPARTIHRSNTETIQHMKQECKELNIIDAVLQGGYPNRYGARIPVHDNWNLNLMWDLLTGYEDQEVCEWLKFGWPSGRLPTFMRPTINNKNHKSADEYPEALNDYIHKEKGHNAIFGPFDTIPFEERIITAISPLSTRAKKNSQERRIIVDLSYPPEAAVNDGMIRDNYMGIYVKLTFPKTDHLAKKIFDLGANTMMWKVDLHRYFRQIGLDPGAWPLIGYMVNEQIWYDKKFPWE